MATTVHLVRHGEVSNPQGVIYGHLPGYHLSERGKEQARQARDHLRERDIGTIWASPLERAQETAEIIAEPHDLEVHTEARLIESGTLLEGVARTFFGIFFRPTNWWKLRNPLKPSWGESYADIRERMLSAVADACEGAGGREIVLVSHQAPVVVAWSALIDRRRPAWTAFDRCPTGTVITVEIEGRRARRSSFFRPAA